MHPEDVLRFWFEGDDRFRVWFGADPAFDAECRERFGVAVEAAAQGRHAEWAATARGRLALVILLDQMPRNIFRGSGRAFAYDEAARALVLEGLDRGDDGALSAVERGFFYLPLEHAEDAGLQALSVRCFTRLHEEAPAAERGMTASFLDYAERHRRVIERFGRFPHRNVLLGRESTPEERAFLASKEAPF
jgi:uncharacterized protein (DUF924 family)